MYVEDPKKLYACFRCGEIGGDVRQDGEHFTCDCCGENGLVTFIQALDILNDFYVNGQFPELDDDYDYEIELTEDEDEE